MTDKAASKFFYTKADVLRLTTFSDTTLWRRVRDGGFPAPIRISAKRVAWPACAVDQWIAAKFRSAPSHMEAAA